MNNTILLAMPDHVGVYQCIKKNLEYHGFIVSEAIIYGSEINYKLPPKPSFFKRLFKNFRPTPLFDYALFIRSDLFTHTAFLSEIKPYVRNQMVGYQWDYMDRFPEIWKAVPFFERFFVFDSDDFKKYSERFLPLTNFYFDYNLEDIQTPFADFYFIGCHVDGRENSINLFAQEAQRNGWSLDFEIVAPSESHVEEWRQLYPHSNIRIGTRFKSFQENLDNTQNGRVLVDFKTPGQEGLSFRSFEALGYRKKLVTTNQNIRNYDFYHPNNIFLWDGKDLSGLSDFLNLPYVEIDPAIREKYSFKNWIRYILDISPYQTIKLPKYL